MCKVYGLRLGLNIGLRPATDKKLYFWLTADKMHAFAFYQQIVTAIRLQWHHFTTGANPNTEIQSKIIEIEIIETQI